MNYGNRKEKSTVVQLYSFIVWFYSYHSTTNYYYALKIK